MNATKRQTKSPEYSCSIQYGHSPSTRANRRKRSRSTSRREHNVDLADEERVPAIGETDELSFFSLSFLPSFVLRLRNYIPRALSAARSSAIIAERSYSRADEHPALSYTYITGDVLRYIQQAYPTHFPLHLAHPCKILRHRMARQ